MSPLTVGLFAIACLLPEQWTPPPPLSLINGLPTHARARERYEAAIAHLENLEAYLGQYEWDGCNRHVSEAYNWREVCRWVMEAADPERDEWARRRALACLVEQCGWRAVVTGEFPTPELLTGGVR